MLLLFTIVAFLKPLLHFLNPLYAELIVEKPRPTKTNDDNIVINSDVGACLMGSIFLEFLGGNNAPHHWIRVYISPIWLLILGLDIWLQIF